MSYRSGRGVAEWAARLMTNTGCARGVKRGDVVVDRFRYLSISRRV